MSSQRVAASSANRSRSSRPPAANQPGAPVAGAGGCLRHHPADAVGMGGAIAAAHLLENEGLPFLVGGRGIGLGDAETDLAGTEHV